MGKSRRRNQNIRKPKPKQPSVHERSVKEVTEPKPKKLHYPMPAYYPESKTPFYIYGQTVTKVRYHTSKIHGPFTHFRITTDYIFAGDTDIDERMMFVKNPVTQYWELAPELELGFMEIIVTTESVVEEAERERRKRST